MNWINRSVLMALLGVFLSGSCWALGEADGYWNSGIAGGKEVAQLAAAWQPQGIKPLPVITNYLDLSQLERKLKEIKEKLKGATDWAANPSLTVGIEFMDEQQPRRATGLMPNANSAGIRIGDEVVQVNGENVRNYTEIGKLCSGKTDVLLTMATGAKIKVTEQRWPALSLDLLVRMNEQADKFTDVLNKLKQQARNAKADSASLAAIAAGAARLDQEMDRLAKTLDDANAQLFANAYKH